MSDKNKKLLNRLIIGLFVIVIIIIAIILILSINKKDNSSIKENNTSGTTTIFKTQEVETNEEITSSIVPSKESTTSSSTTVNVSQKTTSNTKTSKITSKQTSSTTSQKITKSTTTTTKLASMEEDLSKIVDTQNPNYSFHKGQIEFKTSKGCYDAGVEVASIDSVDINNVVCYEVVSKANTVMGYYMRVKCNSGNCNRYKTMIDLSKYN